MASDLDAVGTLAVAAVAARGADDEHGSALAAVGLVGRRVDGLLDLGAAHDDGGGGVVAVVEKE